MHTFIGLIALIGEGEPIIKARGGRIWEERDCGHTGVFLPSRKVQETPYSMSQIQNKFIKNQFVLPLLKITGTVSDEH